MPARTRIAAVALLAAASAALLPVTGARAADAGHHDRTGGDRAVVRDDGPREPSAASAAPREGTAVHPAAGTDGHGVNLRQRDPRVTHREHSGMPRPAAGLRPVGRLHGVRTAEQADQPSTQAERTMRIGQDRQVQQQVRQQVRHATKGKPAGAKPGKPVKRHEAASNPVRRMVQAGQTVGGRRDVGKPLAVGAAALLAVGGGAYGLRLASRRRAARPDA
ncbi:hypothetical protein ABT104_25200 [Streptomyces mobaraensis]|uniref:hypothetical protein n=1 Tax=Streptomyces mobaraensis TaxID=35621 RepID=UPI0033321C39